MSVQKMSQIAKYGDFREQFSIIARTYKNAPITKVIPRFWNCDPLVFKKESDGAVSH